MKRLAISWSAITIVLTGLLALFWYFQNTAPIVTAIPLTDNWSVTLPFEIKRGIWEIAALPIIALGVLFLYFKENRDWLENVFSPQIIGLIISLIVNFIIYLLFLNILSILIGNILLAGFIWWCLLSNNNFKETEWHNTINATLGLGLGMSMVISPGITSILPLSLAFVIALPIIVILQTGLLLLFIAKFIRYKIS